ncbi:MAG: hypothetical protein J7L45_00575, partial [Candidatus Aenigmarchaeota archaeon]|nr:hypothetical protein [Candidatus Aenigmarchaeota archaeon]
LYYFVMLDKNNPKDYEALEIIANYISGKEKDIEKVRMAYDYIERKLGVKLIPPEIDIKTTEPGRH